MKVLSPIEITDAVLTSSSILEDDHLEYIPATSYPLGERVIVLTTHKIYQSLQAANTGNDPLSDPQNDPDNLPVWWVEVGPTNRWAPFDGQKNNIATAYETITYVFTPASVVDGLSLINIDAQQIDVSISFGGLPVYTYTRQLVNRVVSDMYEYFFKPFQQEKNVYLDGLPPLIGAEITITLTRTAGDVSVGIIAMGNSLYLGKAVYGAVSDIKSYSKSEPNQFGTTRLVRRTPKTQTSQTVEADKALTTFLFELREDLESIACIWTTVDDPESEFFNAYILHGIYDRFRINAENPAQTIVDLELREI